MKVRWNVVPAGPTCGDAKSGGGVAGRGVGGAVGAGVRGRGVALGAEVGFAVGSADAAADALGAGSLDAAGVPVPEGSAGGLAPSTAVGAGARSFDDATAAPPRTTISTAAETRNGSGLRLADPVGFALFAAIAESGTRCAPRHCAASSRPIGPSTVWIHSFSSVSRNQVWIAWMSFGGGGAFAAAPFSWIHICSTGFHVKTGVSCRPTSAITVRLTGTLERLTRSWIAVGTQSVGGGTSTLLLIRRLAVERERWLSPREFGELWALSQLSPGIHLVALAGLVGDRVAGWRGVAATVGGMLVPAAAITVAVTVAYGAIASSEIARAALSGVAPTAAGMTLATALLLIRSTARRARAQAALDLAVSAAAFAAGIAVAIPTVAAIAIGGLIGVVALGRERPTSRETPVG